MKKSVKALLGIVIVLALGAAGIFGYLYFTKDKPQSENKPTGDSDVEVQVAFDSGDHVATVNGVSIVADGTGVRVFKEADRTQKTVFEDPASSPLFNGETAYFIESVVADENITYIKKGEEILDDDTLVWYKNKVYSYNIKTDSVQELFICNSDLGEIVTINDGNIYFTDCEENEIGDTDRFRFALNLYKYDTETKEMTKLIDGFAWNERVGDKVYYHPDSFYKGIAYHELYCFDLKTETSKLITDEKVSVIKIEDNVVYYLTCTYFTEGGLVSEKDYALKKTNLVSGTTETVTELDFYEAGDYALWADCVGDEVYFNYASTAARYDFGDYSYNLKTNTVTKLDENELAVNGLIHKFGALSIVEYTPDTEEENSVTELYRIDGIGKYTKLYESTDLYSFKLTENGLYKNKPLTDEDSIFEIEFIPLDVK